MTAGTAGHGRLALLAACFLFSYLAGQVGHAQTAGPPGTANDLARNLGQGDAGVASAPVPSAATGEYDPQHRSAGNVITVNPAVTHQTMRGWEIVAQAEHLRPEYPSFQNAALDKVVEAGINRVRFEVRSGSEHTNDVFGEWRDAGYPGSGSGYTAWRTRRYETINDNADPTVINGARYFFTEIDSTADRIVNPLRQRLAAKGEQLWVNMTYVSFYSQVTSGAPYVHAAPAEYAEFMLATFQHLQQKYGWVPNSLEVMLEPDNVPNPWSGTYMGQVIAATGQKLAANGFFPAFVGPATMCMSTAISYFDQMMAVPGVGTYLKELSYHRYCGVDTGSLQTIASRAQAAGISTAMLEWWDSGNTFNTLHDDLKLGRNSAWEQATVVDLSSPGGLAISHINLATPTVATLTNPTKFTQQYYKYVRQGAVRIDASSNTGGLDPLAFRNTNGLYTVVVRTSTGGAFSISGLPAGTYGIYYTASSSGSPTSPDQYAVSKPDQTIAAGQDITTDIPAYGVITVYGKAGNPAPTATNDAYATAYNTPLTVAAPGVLGNDNANGGGTMTAALQSAASSGTVSLNANGSFIYTPATGFSGPATFTYRASNTGGQSNVATVTVTVAAAPPPPVAANDTYATAYNTVLTVAAPGVLGNDNANGGGTMTAALQSAASSGTVSLNANGSFTYTPATGFSGAATFTYRATNANGQSNIATVTVTVAAAPTPPVAANDSYATGYNTPLTVAAPGVLGNDNASGGGTMTAALQSGASSGAVSLNTNGGFTYTPATGFSGAATFTYRATNANGQSNIATVTVTVAAAPTPPVAANDSYATGYNTPLTVAAPGVLANDNASGGGTMTAALQSAASSGTVSLNANGGFTYTPATGFSGAATFSYRASNANGQSNIATVSVSVAAAPTPPVAANDSYATAYNTLLSVAAPGVLGNDNANGGGTMTAALQSAASSGTVSLNPNGGFTYMPVSGFSGTATFTYRASNANGQSNTATVTVTVAAPTPPAATNDGYSTAHNTVLTVAAPGVLGNDNANGGGTMTAALQSAASSGVVSLNANGSFTYTPATGFSGTATFTYRASNANGQSNIATVAITVAAAPVPPVATNDSYATAHNTALTVAAPGVLGNDSASGSGTMTAVLQTAASSGTVSLNGNGGFTYTPATGFSGPATFTYRASNTGGQSNVATVTVTVGVPSAPTATNDSYVTPFNTPITVAAPGVLANDNANGGGSMTAVLLSAASSGSVTLNPNGQFTYAPFTGFSGPATFTYRASNASGQSNVATVTVTVTAPILPTANNDVYATAFNTPLTVAAPGVLGNDSTNGGSAITAVLQSAASSGSVTLNANGSFTYAPLTGFSGAATFTYRASNTGGQSNLATVTVNVAGPNLPVAANDVYATAFNTPLTVAAPGVLANDNTNGGGTLTAVQQSGATSGTVIFNANGGFTYTPANGFSGAATFTYRASNTRGLSNLATVTVTVAAATPPGATDDTYSTPYNTVLNVPAAGVLANDQANGGGTLTAVQRSAASSGTAVLNANGSLTYTPASGFSGTATFWYRAANAGGTSDGASVRITVAPLNAPTSADDSYDTPHGTPLDVAAPGVLSNDTANGGGTMTAGIVSTTSNGLLSLSANGGFTYTPNGTFSGVDTFTYRAANISGAGTTATVSIAVATPGEPLRPKKLRVGAITGNTVTLSWSPPRSGPTPTGYQIEGGLAPGQSLGVMAVGPVPSVTIPWPTGSYYIRVRTLAGSAISAASNEVRAVVNVPAAPSAPANLLGLVDGDRLDLAWTNTLAGGAPTSVTLNVSGTLNGSAPLGLTDTFSFAGVPPGVYTFSVVATNASGGSVASNPVTLTFPSACSRTPEAVENFVAYNVGAALFLGWDPPASGAAPTTYVLNVTGSYVGSIPTPLKAMSGNVPAGTYHLSVVATNACGPGTASPVQTVVIP